MRLAPICALFAFALAAAAAEVPVDPAAALAEQDRASAHAAAAALAAYHGAAAKVERTLAVFYLSTADQPPYPGHAERLDRVLKHIQGFYRTEMEARGFGPLTFPLETDAQGKLVLHQVASAKSRKDFPRSAFDRIVDEVRPAMKAAGIDPERSTVLIVTTLPEGAPFAGRGDHRSGTCCAIDLPHLDPLRFGDHAPEPLSGKTVGESNTIYIGGIAHELGHAFGLPHQRGRALEDRPGTSLMGSGNYTYGRELRGAGAGTMLAMGDALRLASHPLFCGADRDPAADHRVVFHDLAAVPDGQGLVISGRIEATPAAYALVAYDDPEGGDDYDAFAYPAIPDAQGRFTVRIARSAPGKTHELRLTACHLDGATAMRRWQFTVAADGTADLRQLNRPWAFAEVMQALAGKRDGEVPALIDAAVQQHADDADLREWAAWFRRALAPAAVGPAPGEAVATAKALDLSASAWASARVGYSTALRDHVPAEPDAFPLQVAGVWHARGLFTHAPAAVAYRLGGAWKSFTGSVGIQDGHDGSVGFAIVADGVERWTRAGLRPGRSAAFTVDVSGVRELELRCDDGGDGNRSDWAVWLDPVLTR
jgi:cytochrome c553